MKNYYNSKELEGLPGLPMSSDAIRKMARRKNWKHRPRKERGGGQEFHCSSLPMETRAALAAKIIEHPKAKRPYKTAVKTVSDQALAHALDQLAVIQQQQEILLSESRKLVKILLSVIGGDR